MKGRALLPLFICSFRSSVEKHSQQVAMLQHVHGGQSLDATDPVCSFIMDILGRIVLLYEARIHLLLERRPSFIFSDFFL